MNSLAIETNRLRKVYRGAKKPAVDSLELNVRQGQVFGFLGPNGAGKTTTIGMLLGNVFPTSGNAFLFGKPIGDREIRRRVGYLPEKFQFHDFLTVTEFLDIHGRLYGMDAQSRRRRIPETLEMVGLADRAQSALKTFSKGMQQRAGLAQAILHEPDLVILDEPTSALDPLGRRAVREIVERLKAKGTTVLLNSHLLSEVERTCDEVAILRAGRVIRQGTVEQIAAPLSTVTIELETLTPSLLEMIGRIGAFSRPASTEATITFESVNDHEIPNLVASLVGVGGRIHSVIPNRESLEDIFVRLMDDEAT